MFEVALKPFTIPKPPVAVQAPVAKPTSPAFHAPSQPPLLTKLIAILTVPLFSIELVNPAAFVTTVALPTIVVIPVAPIAPATP